MRLLKIIVKITIAFVVFSVAAIAVYAYYTSSKRMPRENVALYKKVITSSNEGKLITDGDVATFWQPDTSEKETWLQIDLDDVYTVDKIVLQSGTAETAVNITVGETTEQNLTGNVNQSNIVTTTENGIKSSTITEINKDGKLLTLHFPNIDKAYQLFEVEVYTSETIGPDRDKAVADMRVATFNLAAGKKPIITDLQRTIEREQVDAIGFQEVDKYMVRNPFNMLDKVAGENLPYQAYGKAMKYIWADYGVGFASKHPIIETTVVDVPTNQGDENRVYQRVVIEKAGKQIAIYNTHLSFESQEIRQKQFTALKKAVDADSIPYKIMLGDFNADITHAEYDFFKDDYVLANGGAAGWFDTFNGIDADINVRSLDNIIVSKNIEIIETKLIPSRVSDHYLFYIDINLK